ncbi:MULTISPECIES: hypothetical protein [Prauserella]|uniref:SPOR domain-containing protein n=2 Tax=Prauserella TaxID=142577 RepID=A0A318M3S2_9PSEU|nr:MULTISPECIES: hypothetical protein [Prauserella]PXY19941.1 hypothetical protein BAY59_33375 [Prauserella coralliicola]PXY37436.1 hypothetical protein BA062_06860 [Prauserella flavalba]RBM11161.1 hypothetical protein DI005_34410 [Prauserella sp. PE36]TKG64527.1 hypothetical protein FCN18_28725 [Prauserella endophytica]
MAPMSKDPNPAAGWWYNTRTGEVEHGELSRSIDRLGPYPDEATARRALEIARERTRAADRADADWDSED